jgi:hypothetical protein
MTESSIMGRARIGDTTVASVTWTIQTLGSGSFVTLCATVDAAGPLDALLLRLGARRWLARRFAAALEHLSRELGTVSEHSGAGHRRQVTPHLLQQYDARPSSWNASGSGACDYELSGCGLRVA